MRAVKVTIENFTVEDFSHLMIEKNVAYILLKEEVKSLQFDKITESSVLNKLTEATKRLHEGLEFNEILFYTLIPSRKLHGFSKKYYFDTEEQLRLGFKCKVNQYYMFSILGVFMYLLIVIVPCLIQFPK